MIMNEAHLFLWQLQADPDLFSKTALQAEAEEPAQWQMQANGSLRITRPKIRSVKEQIHYLIQQLDALKDEQGAQPLCESHHYQDILKLVYKHLDGLLLQAKWDKLNTYLLQCQTLPIDDFIYQHLPELVLAYIHHSEASALTSVMGLHMSASDSLDTVLHTALQLFPQPINQAGQQCLAYCLYLSLTSQMQADTNFDALNAFKSRVLGVLDKLSTVPGFQPDFTYENYTLLERIAEILPNTQALLDESQSTLKALELQFNIKQTQGEALTARREQCEEETQAVEEPSLLRLLYFYSPAADHHALIKQKINDLTTAQQTLKQETAKLWEQIQGLNQRIRTQQLYIKLYIDMALRLRDQQAKPKLVSTQSGSLQF